MNTIHDDSEKVGKDFLSDLWAWGAENSPGILRGLKVMILFANGFRMYSVMLAVSENWGLALLSLIFSEGGVILWDFGMNYQYSDPETRQGRTQLNISSFMHWLHVTITIIFSFIDILRVGFGVKVGDLKLINNYDAVTVIGGAIIFMGISNIIAATKWIQNDALIQARKKTMQAAAKATIAGETAKAKVHEANAPILAEAEGQLAAVDELRKKYPDVPNEVFAGIAAGLIRPGLTRPVAPPAASSPQQARRRPLQAPVSTPPALTPPEGPQPAPEVAPEEPDPS